MSRTDRVASLIKREVATIIRRTINDSRIGFVSIVAVEVSPDLRHATIYYSQFGSAEERKKTERGLRSAASFIKGELGKVLNTRTVPDLRFKYDVSVERGFDLVQKINQLSQE